ELDKFCKKEINKPAPQVSTHTIPSSEWEMPVPNPSRLIPSRLTRENLVKELEKRKIQFDNHESKERLINRLENQLAEDVKKARIVHNEINNSFKKNDHTFEGIKFPLNLGWALKVNQKFGKKGAGKRISPEIRILLEGYFLAGNINKSDRYTAQDMHDELVRLAQEGEIKMEEVPK
ncbi:2172_t:CDS:2, partial [Gigaspora margarita]